MSNLWTLNMGGIFVISCILLVVTPALSKEAKQLDIAVLGKDVFLGALYNAKLDQVSAKSLWDHKTIVEGKIITEKPNTEFKIESVNTVKDKFSFMDIAAHLKMSLMDDQVNVEGSASYLKQKNSHGQTASVTMRLKKRTRTERIPSEVLNNIEYPENLKETEDTHVITQIDYGADAYFIFSKEVQDNESKEDITGQLKLQIKKFGIEGDGKANITDKTDDKTETISVDFKGDFKVTDPPRTFSQAIDVVNTLSKSNDSVAMRIKLTPLHSISTEASQFVVDINENTVGRAVTIKSNFVEIDEILEENLSSQTVIYFPKLAENLNTIQRMFKAEAGKYTADIRRLLPDVRSGKENISALIQVVNKFENNAFQKSFFDMWMERREVFSNPLTKQLKIISKKATILSREEEFLSYQLDHQNCYYLLKGTLVPKQEMYYIKALEDNDSKRANDAPKDNDSWVKTYTNKVFRILRKFRKLNQLKSYNTDKSDEGKIELPLRAVHIDMPRKENKLDILIFYGTTQITINPVEDIRFEDGSEDLFYKKTQYADIEEEEAEYDDDYSLDINILGYEIRYYDINNRRKSIVHTLDILRKSSLKPGVLYKINVRVIIQGGVRGPWNHDSYMYTLPDNSTTTTIPPEQELGTCLASFHLINGCENDDNFCKNGAIPRNWFEDGQCCCNCVKDGVRGPKSGC